MKKNFLSMLSLMMLLVMIFSMGAFASSGTGKVKVGKNSVMMQAETGISRSRGYTYALVTADSVYPVGNYEEDTYKYCLTRLYHNTIANKPVSAKYQIKEGTTYQIQFYEGYYNLTKFDLCFAGNSPDLAAYVIYTYNGK